MYCVSAILIASTLRLRRTGVQQTKFVLNISCIILLLSKQSEVLGKIHEVEARAVYFGKF